MINHLRGRLVEKSPTHAVIECGGVGYFVNISLNTFAALGDSENCVLHTHLAIRDDAHVLYGFHEEDERAVFLKLISVSGVGASIGRMILSSMNASEIRQAIFNEDVAAIKSVKGVGAKTAERIIVDLKDKIFREDPSQLEKVTSGYNTTKSEALSALSSLGFDKKKAEKTLESILKQHGDDIAVELLIKYALKQL